MIKKIKEVIIVEGKSDIQAVKRAFDGNVDVVATHGLGLGKALIKEISELNERRGIIVLTDPDYAGKRISNIIRDHIPNAKFANIARAKAMKNQNIGVENASDKAIIEAIESARPEFQDFPEEFDLDDIIDNKLNGFDDSKDRRIKLCKELSLSYCNAKQLLIKLNSYGITRQEFENAIERIENEQR